MVNISMHSYIDLNVSSDDLTVIAAKLLLASCYMPHDGDKRPLGIDANVNAPYIDM